MNDRERSPSQNRGGAPVAINASHPQYELYEEFEALIDEHYKEMDERDAKPSKAKARKDSSTLLRNARSQVKHALDAYDHGGYTTFHGKPRHWKSFLPSKATLMLTRYLDSTGTINAFISNSVLSMNCGWMLMIPGRDPDIDTATSGGEDDAFVARKLAVDAAKQAKSLKENFQSFVKDVVIEVEHIRESIDNLQRSHANQDTYIADSFGEVRQTGEHHAALIENLQQQLNSLRRDQARAITPRQMTPQVVHGPAQTDTSGGKSSSFGNPSTPNKPSSKFFPGRHTPTPPSGAAARATTGAKGGVTKKPNYGNVFSHKRGN